MGPEISLIAVAPHGPGGEPIPTTIEEMAADRLPAILEAQRTGPYRLAGHCMGGIVSLETARLLMKLNHQVETVVMIDSPLMIHGETVRSPRGHPDGGDEFSVPKSDDVPIRPLNPEIDWGIEPYTKSLAAYAAAPLPVSAPLLVIAAEYDGRVWLPLSDNATLRETRGVHFDLVTRRIDDLAVTLTAWLSDASSARGSEGRTFAPASKEEGAPAGLNQQNFEHSPRRGQEHNTPALAEIGREINSALIEPTKNGAFSRRLKRFFNYARR